MYSLAVAGMDTTTMRLSTLTLYNVAIALIDLFGYSEDELTHYGQYDEWKVKKAYNSLDKEGRREVLTYASL